MRKIKSTNAEINGRELIMILFILACVGFFAILGVRWYAVRMQHGDDKLTLNTAISVSKINSSDGQSCPVDGCGGGDCAHRQSDGSYIGYFDNISNKVVGEKVYGYNEYTTMRVGEHRYTGGRGTKIIRVKTKDGSMKLSWVDGRRRPLRLHLFG